MADIAIIKMSGGKAKHFAAISVTYPAGATVTCSNGSKTLAAEDSTGKWMFSVPSAGTWTVTADKDGNTKSQSVVISTEGQHESVSINFELWLVQDGVDNTEVTGGWTAAPLWLSNDVSSRKPDITFRSGEMEIKQSGSGAANSGMAYTTNPIDLSSYSSLSINSYSEQEDSNHAKLVVWKDTPNNKTGVANVGIGVAAVQTHTLDVSSLSGPHYIGVYLYKYNGGRILVKDGIKLE